MENNIPTLYILQRDSYVVKSAKIRPFCPGRDKTLKRNRGNGN